ncbi:multidrug ABC transporter ATPase [Actinoplanes sp. SE50]|uniref:ABC transporter ATP-binding protein n=1 Tax=unclassified Actinoplanes TaxID=2626549 RepID=UPI00023EC7C6|nr:MULTISPECIES: ABC transporter ATP-binding protein [unclassified Actinoplanes]AEV84710.1 Spermidine/putrescine import ATP-binding protein potA [Actinoplanes sp. SE50/110]ATO83102.1 multidrug ABC transporter ATPase [Actinoplanes sp. SE50]SLM00509.1 multidrug ABC transporter ATP-binding protein [Actinoplanes sp. SE50/110]
MTAAAIEVRGLSRRYGGPGGFEAVRDVSFSVQRGELFALLGTNGAGKTSTLEVVEGQTRPNAGTVRVLGHDPHAARAAVRPRMGVMLQEGGFPADLTVVETARMWAGTLAVPRPVSEALALVGLDHRTAVRTKQLSGGERRRLDLALALLGRPELLVLDEPTTGLDPESRHATWQLIRGLLAEGVTILLTTHYLGEAQGLADRLAIMHRGQVVTTGSVADVVAAYPARVSFGLPAGIPVDALPELPGAHRPESGAGGQVTVHTAALQATLTALLCWADQRGVVLAGLDARSASLEEAFLSIAAGRQP